MQAYPPPDHISPTTHCVPGDESSQEHINRASLELRTKLKITVSREETFRRPSELATGEKPVDNQGREIEAEDEIREQGSDGDDFSFACEDELVSPISADVAFHNGQIKPIFPLFDQSLLSDEVVFGDSGHRLPIMPPVDKIFIETDESPSPSSSKTEQDDEPAGPYCSWSKKAVEASPDVCKKSNSTGFSRFRRFREFLNRSHSDGRDAFVFLNGSAAATGKKEEKDAGKSRGSSSTGKKKDEVDGGKLRVTGEKVKGKKKGETKSLSAHEKYMKNRASSGGDRRRSYLPYRPELVGFFTNVNGGLTRNVHPF